MLTKDCKKVLNIYTGICRNSGEVFGWDVVEANLPKHFDKNKLVNTLEYLKSLDYLDFECNVLNEVVLISFSHKALRYKEISWLKVKDFLLKSIFTPIVVALITTLITDYLLNK